MERAEILEALACEWGQRPAGAPTTANVLPSVRSVTHVGAALVVEFEASAAPTVATFVDAERRCCSTIGWEMTTQPVLRLRLSGTPSQLEALEQMFSQPDA